MILTRTYLTSALKEDALILRFSEIVNSQAAFTTAKTLNKFADGIIKFVRFTIAHITIITIFQSAFWIIDVLA